MDFKVKSGVGLCGEVSLPGDKSISHRSIMCAALAEGTTTINGFLAGEDCLATLDAFTKMGVDIKRDKNKVQTDPYRWFMGNNSSFADDANFYSFLWPNVRRTF